MHCMKICDVQFPVYTLSLFMRHEHKSNVNMCFEYFNYCKIKLNSQTYTIWLNLSN